MPTFRERFDDARDLCAITLMGWSSSLATPHYRRYLAQCIQAGMDAQQPTLDEVEAHEEYERLVTPGESLFEQMGGTLTGPKTHSGCCHGDCGDS